MGLAEKIGFPSELVPLVFVKMFSSSAATGRGADIFKTHGRIPDRNDHFYYDRSCTETILYAEYFIFSGKGNEDEAYFKKARCLPHWQELLPAWFWPVYGFLI